MKNRNHRIHQGVLCLLALASFVFGSSAWAQVAVMPDRVMVSGTESVVWGNSTIAPGDEYTFDFGDASPTVDTTPMDTSYVAQLHTYTTALPAETFTATLTHEGGTSASVTITVVNDTFLDAEEILDLQINQAIEDGLRSQYFNQNNREANFAGGEFAEWGGFSVVPYTSLSVLAFENHGHNAAAGTIYSELVQRGLNTIFDKLTTVTLSDDGPGDPCVEIYAGANYGDPMAPGPDCTGLGLPDFDQGYATAVALLAVAGSGAPNAVAAHGTANTDFTVGMTYLEIVQRLLNTIAFAQNGGWIYGYNGGNDGSTNGWNALAIFDGVAFGGSIADFVLPEFDIATEALTISADPMADNYGGMGYGGKNAENTAKSGIRLQALNLIGYAVDAAPAPGGPAAQATVDYINRGWRGVQEGGFACFDNQVILPQFQDADSGNNFGCLYAMFNVFKGLKLYGIDTIANSGRADKDWHREYKDYLVQTQQIPTDVAGGDWGNLSFSCCSSDLDGETALALLVLSESATILPDDIIFQLALQTVVFGDTAFLGVVAQTTSGNPVPGVTIDFTSLDVPGFTNPGLKLSGVTDANGFVQVSYTYDGADGDRTDEWEASVGTSVLSNTAIVEWVATLDPDDPAPPPPVTGTGSVPQPLRDDDSFFGLAMDPWMLTLLIAGLPLLKRRSRRKM